MLHDSAENIYKTALEQYGDSQLIVAIEELAELQKELCKYLRYKDNYNNDAVAEEIADVEIMIAQMKILFNINSEKIKEYKIKKTLRLAERLKINR